MGTTLQFPTDNGTGIRTKYVRDGVAGNVQVVYQMIRTIRNNVDFDKGIEAVAKNVLTSHGLDSYSPARDQMQAVYDFVKANVAYIQDIAGRVESIKSARQTLSDGYGDCDDHTNTNATLLGCLGFENVCVALARYDQNDPTFSHVYCVAYQDGKRYVLDTTLPNGKFGDEVRAVDIKEVNVFGDVQGLDGFGGVFNNAYYQAKKLGKAATQVIPHAVSFLPLGFIPSNALATGAALLNQNGYEQLSFNATASRINQELDKIIYDLMRSRIAIDLARSYAMQCVVQLSAVTETPADKEAYIAIKNSVNNKLQFINNFETYAQANGIRVVVLDARMMLLAGGGMAAYGAYKLYKSLKGR
jgi:predicted transglutaminase-like cysteine proteinase